MMNDDKVLGAYTTYLFHTAHRNNPLEISSRAYRPVGR